MGARLKTLFQSAKKAKNASETRASSSSSVLSRNRPHSQSPVMNYYRYRLQDDAPSFLKFALNSGSLEIRDIFAKAVSPENFDLVDLLTIFERSATASARLQESHDTEVFDHNILMTLGDLLANTARNEWDTNAAITIYDFVFRLYGQDAFQPKQELQFLESLVEAERYDQFDKMKEVFDIKRTAASQLALLEIQRVRQSSSEGSWLGAMNSFYSSLGRSQIRLTTQTDLPLLDRLEADTSERIEGPKVTIIVPTYSPSSGIFTALRSLLQQTWENLEIIVVDDASPSKYQEIFNEIEDMDPKIRVVRQDVNAGAYVARNIGLKIAEGQYITIHDDDDWSHPDKIALQVRALTEDITMVASTSEHVRTSEDLHFRRINTKPVFLQMNYSSIMFHRSLVDEIGAWDTVNRGADGEFLLRVIANYGSSCIANIADVPLSLSRTWAGSLTSGEMQRGYFAPSRLLYREAFRKWHREIKKNGSRVHLDPDKPRDFPVPTNFEPGQRKADLGKFDIVFVSDFYRQAKYSEVVIAQMGALAEEGLRVGYIQLPSPETTKHAGFSSQLFDLQISEKITQIAHNDLAETDLLVVYGSAIGMFLDQTKSSLYARRSILVDHELPSLSSSEDRWSVFLGQAIRHLDSCFNTRFEVTGASVEDYERLVKILPQGRLLPEKMIWHMFIDDQPSPVAAPTNVPHVGFHTQGNIYRWPSTLSLFENIYKSPNYRTSFYGNIKPACKKYGEAAFENIDVSDHRKQSEQEFLNGIDFWIYHPHHRLTAQLWVPVLKAMRAGKVVILPPYLYETYGAAALYAEPDEVRDVVERLSHDEEAFVSQAYRGQAFVAQRHTVQRLRERYDLLVSGFKQPSATKTLQ